MLEVVGFYFQQLGNLIESVFGSVFVVPGVSLLAFFIAAALIMLFISLLKLRFDDSFTIYTQQSTYEPRHVYQAKHARGKQRGYLETGSNESDYVGKHESRED